MWRARTTKKSDSTQSVSRTLLLWKLVDFISSPTLISTALFCLSYLFSRVCVWGELNEKNVSTVYKI